MNEGFKIGLIAVFFLALSSKAQCQGISIGVFGGPNLTAGKTGIRETESLAAKVAFQIGGSVQVNLTDRVGLNSGLGFMQRRSEEEVRLTDEFGQSLGVLHFTHAPDYLHLPISFTYRLVKGLQLKVGPRIWYNIGGRIKQDGTASRARNDLFHSWDYGAGIDLFYELGDFNLSVFFIRSFNDLINVSDARLHSTFGINLGYTIFRSGTE